EPHIAEAAVAAQHHVAEVLKLRVIRMPHVGNLRLHNFRLRRACVIEKLIHLVRTDIAQNAAELLCVPEPFWSSRTSASVARTLKDLVRRDIDGLDHLADRALLYQLTRIYSGLHLKPLAVHDGVDAAGLGDGLAHIRELFERCDARLV